MPSGPSTSSQRSERRGQHLADFVERLSGPAGEPGDRQEAVGHADVVGQPHVDARVGEPVGVAASLVAQRVVLGGDDERRRQPGQRRGADRRQPRIGQVGPVAQVVGAVGQAVPLGQHDREVVLGSGRVLGSQVRRRVDQRLVPDAWSALIARLLADDGRQVAAGAVTHDGQPLRVGAELPRMPSGPQQTVPRVVDRSREPVLGRQSVADGDDDRADPAGDLTAQPRVVVLAADDPPATVQEHDDRQVTVVRRAIHHEWDLRRPPLDATLVDPHVARGCAVDQPHERVVGRSGAQAGELLGGRGGGDRGDASQCRAQQAQAQVGLVGCCSSAHLTDPARVGGASWPPSHTAAAHGDPAPIEEHGWPE